MDHHLLTSKALHASISILARIRCVYICRVNNITVMAGEVSQLIFGLLLASLLVDRLQRIGLWIALAPRVVGVGPAGGAVGDSGEVTCTER